MKLESHTFVLSFNEIMNYRILLVEDEESLQDVIKLNLELEGYTVFCAGNGIDALKYHKTNRFDLIVLDVMLPELDGFSVCQTIRLEDNKTPILFLTAKDSGQDRIKGLRIGGDDYLVKPFNLEELLLRVEKLLKRSENGAKTGEIKFKFGGNSVNFETFTTTNYQGDKKQLTEKEAKLLRLLINNESRVVSRKEILDFVWGYDVYPTTRTIDNFILGFRKFYEQNPKIPGHFHSIRSIGYKFTS